MANKKSEQSPKKSKEPAPLPPANLAYDRSIAINSGVMYAVQFKKSATPGLAAVQENDASLALAEPIRVTATTVLGTVAYDSKTEPAKRVNADKQALNVANLATVEQALLPVDATHLLVKTQVRFVGNSGTPNLCSKPAFSRDVAAFVQAYYAQGGYHELARRYILNILNGSWLWRNRYGDNLQVSVTYDGQTWLASEADLDMRLGFVPEAMLNVDLRQWVETVLIPAVAAALAGVGSSSVSLEVQGLVEMGGGAEVFPSQEIPSNATETVVKGQEVSKILSKERALDGSYVATIHARKIGNALRTIDTWHGQPNIGAIAVEPFGARTRQSEAHRVYGNDLYSYLRDPVALTQSLITGVTGVHHFVAACLIRGGPYGFAEGRKDKAESDKPAPAEGPAADDAENVENNAESVA